jgi:hypothetical protein
MNIFTKSLRILETFPLAMGDNPSINILRFVMIGQRTPLVILVSDWLKVSANSSPL